MGRRVDDGTGTKHKIDLPELLGLIQRGVKIPADIAKFHDGATPAEVATLLADIAALGDAIREAQED